MIKRLARWILADELVGLRTQVATHTHRCRQRDAQLERIALYSKWTGRVINPREARHKLADIYREATGEVGDWDALFPGWDHSRRDGYIPTEGGKQCRES